MKNAIVGSALFAVTFVAALGEDLSTGLIARYDLDGHALDSSGLSNHATPAGNHSFIAAGRTGGALRIHGDGALFYSGGGHLLLPPFSAALNQGLTVSLWVKDESIGTDPVGEEQYLSLGAVELPQIGISLNRNNPSAPELLFFLDPVGTGNHPGLVLFAFRIADFAAYAAAWKHLVIVYEPGRFAAFLDGSKIGEGDGSFSGFPVATAALGRHWWSGGGASSARMSATFDDVRIYNRALSDAAVLELFTGEPPCAERIAELEAEITLLEAEKIQLQQDLAAANQQIAALQADAGLLALSLDILEANYRQEFRDPQFQISGTSLTARVDRLIQALLSQPRGHKQSAYRELSR